MGVFFVFVGALYNGHISGDSRTGSRRVTDGMITSEGRSRGGFSK